jgi:hypothetical protein
MGLWWEILLWVLSVLVMKSKLGSKMEHDGDKNNQGIHMGFQMGNNNGENQHRIYKSE